MDGQTHIKCNSVDYAVRLLIYTFIRYNCAFVGYKNKRYPLTSFLPYPFKAEAQTALFKDPVRTAQ